MTDQNTTRRSVRERYPLIEKWGRMSGSFTYYIVDQQERAARDNAPEDAIFYSVDDARWVRADEVNDDTTRERLGIGPLPADRRAALLRKNAAYLRRQAAENEKLADELDGKGDHAIGESDLLDATIRGKSP